MTYRAVLTDPTSGEVQVFGDRVRQVVKFARALLRAANPHSYLRVLERDEGAERELLRVVSPKARAKGVGR